MSKKLKAPKKKTAKPASGKAARTSKPAPAKAAKKKSAARPAKPSASKKTAPAKHARAAAPSRSLSGKKPVKPSAAKHAPTKSSAKAKKISKPVKAAAPAKKQALKSKIAVQHKPVLKSKPAAKAKAPVSHSKPAAGKPAAASKSGSKTLAKAVSKSLTKSIAKSNAKSPSGNGSAKGLGHHEIKNGKSVVTPPSPAKNAQPLNGKSKGKEPVKPVTKPAVSADTKKTPVTKTAPAAEKIVGKNHVTEIFSKKPEIRREVLAITNTIPVKSKSEISLSKIASISSSITNPVKKTDSYAIKPEKEPAGKFEMEFVVHASAEMLYEFLSTASGLSEWFCDDLNIRNGIYTFIWDDQLQQARLLKTIELQLVRFQWVDKTDGSYFEFKIQRDDLTNDISLIITDFADTVSERESSKLLWNSQIEKLMHVIGSIF
jgi:uncharacterized protein YndB with AHSA1/START domain